MLPSYIFYAHASMDWVYHYMTDFESLSKKSPTFIHGKLKTAMHARRKLAQGEIQALSYPILRRFDGMLQKQWDMLVLGIER